MTDTIVEARFWAKVEKTDGCWLWTGTVGQRGYGSMSVFGKARRATHVAIWLADGEWPSAGMFVCHHCDNPRCVRRSHLFVGSQSENMRDCVRKRRHRFTKVPTEVKPRGEQHGRSKLTTNDVRMIRASKGRVSRRSLAARLGVHHLTVARIQRRESWAHIPEEPSNAG